MNLSPGTCAGADTRRVAYQTRLTGPTNPAVLCAGVEILAPPTATRIVTVTQKLDLGPQVVYTPEETVHTYSRLVSQFSAPRSTSQFLLIYLTPRDLVLPLRATDTQRFKMATPGQVVVPVSKTKELKGVGSWSRNVSELVQYRLTMPYFRLRSETPWSPGRRRSRRNGKLVRSPSALMAAREHDD